jgi:FkbM family methyltransferase
MKPRVYRTQSEKDTWYSVAVENEYGLGPLRPNDVVIDVGAHIGSFSWLAHRMGSRVIMAFEIDPWHYEALLENTKDLGGMAILPIAVVRSDVPKRTMRYNGQWHPFATEGALLDSIALDDILRSAPGGVRFLKLDCEGSEWPILYTSKLLDCVAEIAGEYHESSQCPPDATLPPMRITALAEFLIGKGFLVEWRENAPGIGNFWAWRSSEVRERRIVP